MQADEIKKIIVLPILYRDCELPQFLSDRKYADFRSDYKERGKGAKPEKKPSIRTRALWRFVRPLG